MFVVELAPSLLYVKIFATLSEWQDWTNFRQLGITVYSGKMPESKKVALIFGLPFSTVEILH
jgi:hypothetical protein